MNLDQYITIVYFQQDKLYMGTIANSIFDVLKFYISYWSLFLSCKL